ncbi:unnamed protein product [Symbiodinium natans]|uniref:Uncharacterized protein n=1 Tax=Symbiodinium natans TaxID=878477 RepID=A0A812T9E9_9DINO|nr:unnamed protein product [Symbiodinium natans]
MPWFSLAADWTRKVKGSLEGVLLRETAPSKRRPHTHQGKGAIHSNNRHPAHRYNVQSRYTLRLSKRPPARAQASQGPARKCPAVPWVLGSGLWRPPRSR